MTKRWLWVLSMVSLAACLAAPILRFMGKLSSGSTNLIFLGASVGWFVFATLRARLR
jgi:hypothetical protein